MWRSLTSAALGAALVIVHPNASLSDATLNAMAQVEAPNTGARALYDEGVKRFRSGEFREALELFEKAYALDPDPVLVYNIARAHESLGDGERALDAYKRYLESSPNAEDRGAVEQRMSTLQRQIRDKQLLEQQRDAAAKPAAEPRRRPASEHCRRRSASRVPWIIAAVGAGGVGAGAVLGAIAISRYDDAVSEPSAGRARELETESQSIATAANV